MGVTLAGRVRREVRASILPGCGLLMALLYLVYVWAVLKTYTYIARAFSGEMAATAITIVFLSFPSLLLQKSSTLVSPAPAPFWIRLLLILDPAVEFPLLFAFHPTTLLYNRHRLFPIPAPEQLAFQVLGLFVVEWAFQNCVLRFVRIPGGEMAEVTDSHCGTMRDALGVEDEGVRDGCAEDLMVHFLRLRGALLVAVAVMGVPTVWTTYVGLLHPMAMAVWVALQRDVRL